MSDNTPRTGLPLLAAAQAQKHVTHNEALLQLDALMFARLLDRDLAAPPASPADGDTYLVAAGASGSWAGQDGNMAYAVDGGWRFYVPFDGQSAYVADEGVLLVYTSAGWADLASVLNQQNIPLLGVNTIADSTNKFAVKSAAVLLDNAGDDVQVKVNKKASADTASFLLQKNYSGRAEFGLTGDDDFHLKVSSDGSIWTTALAVNASNGVVDLPALPAVSVNRNGTDQSGLTAHASNIIAFNHVAEDTKSWFDTTNYRYTPQSAGLYMVVMAVALSFSASPDDSPQSYIYKNGSLLINGSYAGVPGGGSGAGSIAFGLIRFNGTTDYIDGRVFVPSNTTVIRGGVSQTFLQGWKIAP